VSLLTPIHLLLRPYWHKQRDKEVERLRSRLWVVRVLARNSVAFILVVDDEYSIAEVLKAALTDAGHEVMTAMNGQQGLERLRERRPDLVLLDL
jgi:PleD family two-component response regulator